jgi:hypothetical protein
MKRCRTGVLFRPGHAALVHAPAHLRFRPWQPHLHHAARRCAAAAWSRSLGLSRCRCFLGYCTRLRHREGLRQNPYGVPCNLCTRPPDPQPPDPPGCLLVKTPPFRGGVFILVSSYSMTSSARASSVRGHIEPEGLRGLQVDHQLVSGRGL